MNSERRTQNAERRTKKGAASQFCVLRSKFILAATEEEPRRPIRPPSGGRAYSPPVLGASSSATQRRTQNEERCCFLNSAFCALRSKFILVVSFRPILPPSRPTLPRQSAPLFPCSREGGVWHRACLWNRP